MHQISTSNKHGLKASKFWFHRALTTVLLKTVQCCSFALIVKVSICLLWECGLKHGLKCKFEKQNPYMLSHSHTHSPGWLWGRLEKFVTGLFTLWGGALETFPFLLIVALVFESFQSFQLVILRDVNGRAGSESRDAANLFCQRVCMVQHRLTRPSCHQARQETQAVSHCGTFSINSSRVWLVMKDL